MKPLKVSVASLLVLLVAACSLDVGPQERDFFQARLTAIVQPPPTRGDTTSAATTVILIEDGRIFLDLFLVAVEGARTATLHIGDEESNTPAVATIWQSPNAATTGTTGSGFVVQGRRLNAADVTGVTYQQLVEAIRAYNAYVVLTTIAHPAGAFRGQVQPPGV
jgi:hypothetical protein